MSVRRILAFLDHAAEPGALDVALDVLELEADRGGVDSSQPRDGVGGGVVGVETERRAGDRGEISLGYAMEFGLKLGSASRGRAKRVDLNRQMAVLADGLNEGGGAGDLAQIRWIGGCRGHATAELGGHGEELAPGLVHGGGIALETLLHFGHVSVVERGDDRQNGHSCNVTSLPRVRPLPWCPYPRLSGTESVRPSGCT